MNNSATCRRITKIAIEYNGNDKGEAELIYSNNLLSDDPEEQYKEMKAVAERNKNVKNWSLTGYISPEKSIGDNLTKEEFTQLALKALKKVGLTDENQIVLHLHSSTKQNHVHFIVNRVNIRGTNTVKAHKIGEKFGNAVREVCKKMNLKTDVEIGKEKKQQMLLALNSCLKVSKNFEELLENMKKLGYRVTLSQNTKDGISGMRIVRFNDINYSAEKDYKPGYKLSEITNRLKIADVKRILHSNQRSPPQTDIYQPAQKQEGTDSKVSISKQVGSVIEELLKPNYTSPDEDLFKKKKWKKRK